MKLGPALLPLLLLAACSDDGPPSLDGSHPDGAAMPDAGEAPSADRPPEAAGADAGADVTDGSPPREVPAAALLEIEPAVHDFGNVVDNDVVSKHFRVKNVGGSASGSLDIKLDNGDSDPNAFDIVSNGCESTLEPETSCEIEISFRANLLGPHQGLLTAAASPGGMASADLRATVVP